MEKNNQERVRSIWKPLCLLFAALLTLSWVFFGFLYSKGGVNFSMLETSEQEQSASGGMVIGEGESNGVALMSAEISPQIIRQTTFRRWRKRHTLSRQRYPPQTPRIRSWIGRSSSSIPTRRGRGIKP